MVFDSAEYGALKQMEMSSVCQGAHLRAGQKSPDRRSDQERCSGYGNSVAANRSVRCCEMEGLR